MANLQQPQGVSHTFDISQIPDTGFIALEFTEDGQVVLPNMIYITGENSSPSVFVLNDGLLRTHNDKIIMHIKNDNSGEHTYTINIAKNPILKSDDIKKDNVAKVFELAIPTGEHWQFELQQIDGEYIASHRVVDTGKTL